jgi:hypothetical protein
LVEELGVVLFEFLTGSLNLKLSRENIGQLCAKAIAAASDFAFIVVVVGGCQKLA